MLKKTLKMQMECIHPMPQPIGHFRRTQNKFENPEKFQKILGNSELLKIMQDL